MRYVGQQFVINMDARYGRTWGIDWIDGKPHWENGTKVDIRVFDNDKPRTVLCSVRKGSIQVSVDGRTLIRWRADYGRVSLPTKWQVSDKRLGFLGSWKSSFHFSRIVLTPVSGRGSPLR